MKATMPVMQFVLFVLSGKEKILFISENTSKLE